MHPLKKLLPILIKDYGFNWKGETEYFKRHLVSDDGLWFGSNEDYWVKVIELITSKEFIDSMCRYIEANDLWEVFDNREFFGEEFYIFNQAKAIYEGKEEEFLSKFLK